MTIPISPQCDTGCHFDCHTCDYHPCDCTCHTTTTQYQPPRDQGDSA